MSTLIDWPETLPSFPLTEWDYTHNVPMAVSEMEVGPPKRRLRETTDRVIITGPIMLTASQLSIFRDFVINTLSRGTLTFNWPDFVTETSVEVALSIDNNGALYKVKQTGKSTYKVDLTLEVQP